MKRIVPPRARSRCAATAGSSASGATPARSRSDSDAVPSAEASASASRVAAGKPGEPRAHELLERLGNRQRLSGSASTSSTRASSSAKNGLPPDRSWMRSSVWRAKGLPSRSRRNRCSAPTLSGPTGSRWTRSAPSARSSSDGVAPSTRRRASSRAPGSRRAAAARTRARSPRRRRATGRRRSRRAAARRRASSCSALRVAIPSARAIDRVVGRLLEEERDLERTPPRRRQRGQDVVEDVLEQIAEPGVSEAALGFGRSRRQHAKPRVARMLDPGEPERRLPDPGLALEHERGQPCRRSVDEGKDEASSSSLPTIGVTVATSDHGVLSCSLPEPTGAQLRRPLWYEAVTTPHRNRSGERRRMEAGDSVGTMLICRTSNVPTSIPSASSHWVRSAERTVTRHQGMASPRMHADEIETDAALGAALARRATPETQPAAPRTPVKLR